MEIKTKSLVNGILLLVTLVINAMGATGLINGLSQKEISDMYPTLITPSSSTFSIWSVIYTFLIVSIIVMIIKNKDAYYKRAINEISFLFWVSCALNIMWIISFSYNLIGLSLILIAAFLIVMTLIVKRIGEFHIKKRWLLPIAFGLYSGWLFIATVVNVAAWLVKVEWSGWGISAEIWSSIILLISVGLTLIVLLNIKNAIFPIPIAWAYFGIYNNLTSTIQGNYDMIQNVALIGIVFLIVLTVFQFYRNQLNIMPDISVKKN